MAYTFAGTQLFNGSGNVATVSFNIGVTTSPYVWVAVMQAGGWTTATMTVGGVSMNMDVSDTNPTTAIFSGRAAGQSGTVNAVLNTPSAGSFTTRLFGLWYDAADTIALNTTASNPGTGASSTLTVANGNYMFAIGTRPSTTPGNFTASTAAPNNTNSANDGSTWGADFGDWVITAGDAGSFTVTENNTVFMSVASYTVSASAAVTTSSMLSFIGSWT